MAGSAKRRAVGALLLGALVLGALVGCLDLRDEPAPSENACTQCHGDATRSGSELVQSAPPFDLMGNTDTAYPGVGAHGIHLTAGDTHAAMACNECHQVPKDVRDPGHMDTDGPAEVKFGALARKGSTDPHYDPASRRCSDTYCHGAVSPEWTAPRSSANACGSCHGLPPAPPHPQSENCSLCHSEVVDEDLHFVAPDLHVDGHVESNDTECNGCHGSAKNPAPPRDLLGNTDPTSPGVGAHQAHLSSKLGRSLACEECHRVPKKVRSPGHLDGSGVEVTLDQGTFDPQTLRCTDTSCHGEAASSPKWTDPTPLGCDSCHGMPPPAPHPPIEQCSLCHGEVVDAKGKIIDTDLHVDGHVDVQDLACNACHGDADSPAPPRDLLGNEEVTARGVGAHRAHLDSTLGQPLACEECHPVPKKLTSPGHVDGVVDVLLDEGSYDTGTLQCSDTSCHGTEHPTPAWNDPAPIGCSSCHGMPPAAPHPQVENCTLCHGKVAAVDPNAEFGVAIAHPELHVNGHVDTEMATGCTSCHGDPSRAGDALLAAAPPTDTFAEVDSSSPGVGAHQAHLFPTGPARPLECGECHVVPTADDSEGHFDTLRPAEVVFSGIASAFEATPSYEDGTCTNTYCHGGSFIGHRPSGGTDTTPVWTVVDGSQAQCGSCHGMPPPAPHPQDDDNCGDCHHDMDASGEFVLPLRHIDGIVTFFVDK